MAGGLLLSDLGRSTVASGGLSKSGYFGSNAGRDYMNDLSAFLTAQGMKNVGDQWVQKDAVQDSTGNWHAPGWVAPDPLASLRTSKAGLADATLGSRDWHNPNVGVRDVLAVGSVYQQSDVPAFLTNAVLNLNKTQAEREANQEAYRRNLLAAYGSGAGPNAYLLAPALAASAVAPGRSVTIGGRAFENPLVGQGENAVATSHSSAVNTINAQVQARERKIADLKQQISTAWGPAANVHRGNLQMQLADEERALKELQNSAYAQNVSGWVGGI